MTTFTLRGITVTENNRGAVSVVAENLVMRTSDDYLMRYSYVGPVQTDDITEIDLSPGAGMDFQVFVGAERPDGNWTARIGQVTLNGQTTQVMVLDHLMDANKWTLIELGGAPLPALTTPAQVNAFFKSMPSVTGSFAGFPAPDTAFDLRDLSAFVSANENDVLIANGLYDDWEGRTIDTGAGNDRVAGVSANDRFELGSGNDTGIGGSGNDSMFGSLGKDRLLGESGNDLLRGGAGNDAGLGGSGDDKLFGDAGNDRLDGGEQRDKLYGDSGDDSLSGGTGADVLTGGTGADVFDYREGFGRDRITDFEDGADALHITAAGPVTTVAAALGFAVDITGGVRFDFGGSDVLTVLGVTKADLADQIFIV